MERADFENLLDAAISGADVDGNVGFAGVRYGVSERSVASLAIYLASAPPDFNPVVIPHSVMVPPCF